MDTVENNFYTLITLIFLTVLSIFYPIIVTSLKKSSNIQLSARLVATATIRPLSFLVVRYININELLF